MPPGGGKGLVQVLTSPPPGWGSPSEPRKAPDVLHGLHVVAASTGEPSSFVFVAPLDFPPPPTLRPKTVMGEISTPPPPLPYRFAPPLGSHRGGMVRPLLREHLPGTRRALRSESPEFDPLPFLQGATRGYSPISSPRYANPRTPSAGSAPASRSSSPRGWVSHLPGEVALHHIPVFSPIWLTG